MRGRLVAIAGAVALGVCLRAAAVESPERSFDTVFGQEVRAAAASADKADDVQLAGKILEASAKFTSETQTRVYFCRKAYDLAMKDRAGYTVAADAARRLLKDLPDEKPACQNMLAKALEDRFLATPDGARFDIGEELLDVLIAMGDGRCAARDFIGASEFYGRAVRIARTNRSDRVAEAQQKVGQATTGQTLAASLERLLRNYQAKPGDPAAARAIAMLCVVEFNAPEEAAPYVQPSGDAALKQMVPLAMQAMDRVDEKNCLSLAGWYRDLARAATLGREPVLKRAQGYLERFLSLHTNGDPQRVKAETELADVNKALEALRPAAERYRGKWVDLLALVNLGQDVLSGKWSLSSEGLLSPDTMAGLRLPASPQASYELEVVTERVGGDNSAFIFLPAGPRMVCYHVGGYTANYPSSYYGPTAVARKYGPFRGGAGRYAMAGFETIQGKMVIANDAAREYRMDNNVKMTWLLKVVMEPDSRVTLQADLNGKEFVKWQGLAAMVGLPSHCRLDSRGLGIGVSKTSWRFRSVRLKVLSGGLKIRGGETGELPPAIGLLSFPPTATTKPNGGDATKPPAAGDEAAAGTALKMADMLREQRKLDAAKRRYREVAEKYPDTKAAKAAAAALAEITAEEEGGGTR
jgi:tetratricopeptide (TPR) repeat protein